MVWVRWQSGIRHKCIAFFRMFTGERTKSSRIHVKMLNTNWYLIQTWTPTCFSTMTNLINTLNTKPIYIELKCTKPLGIRLLNASDSVYVTRLHLSVNQRIRNDFHRNPSSFDVCVVNVEMECFEWGDIIEYCVVKFILTLSNK